MSDMCNIMSAQNVKPKIADLERALDHRNGWTALETPPLVALLRIARAAKTHANGLCAEIDAALDAFDWE